jgi:hypothetical protein
VEHLVARCPVCERPVWAKQVAKLLGFTTRAGRYVDLGFVAVTRGRGQGRGWRVKEGLGTLADVLRVGGQPAVEQLRKLARQAFSRMWTFGLLTEEDVREVTAVRKADGYVVASHAPAHPVPFSAGYRDGSRIVTPVAAPRLSHPNINPNPAPARAIPFKP